MLAAVLALLVGVQDWPHWRGPERSDVVAEPSGWTAGASWPPKGPAWTVNVGEGCTSPLVVGGRVYVMGWGKDLDQLRCLDAATGKELWVQTYPSPSHGRHHMGDEKFYSGPTATPEYDPATKRIYTLGIDGDLRCTDTAGPALVWSVKLYDVYGAERRPFTGAQQRDYGYITAPLVHGDWVLVQVGAKDGTLMAFSKATGKRAWASECRDPAGHTGGLAPMTVEGVPCVAMLTLHNLVVVRLDAGREGKTVATVPWTTDFGNNVAGPAVLGDSVLVTSEYNRKAIARVRVTLKGAEKVWESPYSSKACTPVIHGGHVYWAWKKLRCLDFETGAQKWEGGDFGDAGSCIVTGDSKLIAWGGNGRLSLVETASASPGEFRELAKSVRVLPAVSWPHVVLAGGRLLCKDRDGNLACFELK